MNHPQAQLIALVCHGNARLRGVAAAQPFFPDHSSCRFCDRVTFAEIRARWFGRARDAVVAASPDAWFAYLSGRGAQGLRLTHRAGDISGLPDRIGEAFSGGGASWAIAARLGDSTEYWKAEWDVWNREAPQQRIWRVAYRRIAAGRGAPRPMPETEAATAALEAALMRILAFSTAHACDPFTDSFRHALDALRESDPARGFHDDLYPEATMPPASRSLLAAAQAASVFGGMGSWNDMGFDGDDGREYEAASAQLYESLNDAICAAANSTDPGEQRADRDFA